MSTDRSIALMHAYLDGELDAAGHRELADWINASPDHAAIFTRQTFDDRRIRDELIAREYQTLRREARLSVGVKESSAAPQADPEPAMGRRVWYLKGSAFSINAVLAALLVIAAALTYLFLPSTPHSQLPAPHSAAPASFAILSDLSNDAAFADGELSLGSALTAPIKLTAGSAQIMFNSTAVVDLIGPCEFQMTGPNRGRLTHGRLEATVPQNAHGFTVDLPHQTHVIDLGTAFRIDAPDDGEPTIHVTRGRVAVTRDDPANPIALTLAAGQVMRWVAGRVVLNDADLAAAAPQRVLNIDLGPTPAYDGPGVAGAGGHFWNRVAGPTADKLLAADGKTPWPLTLVSTVKMHGQRPGQAIGLFDDYAFSHIGSSPWTMRLDGLDDRRTYDLILFAATGIAQGADFTVAGVTRSTTGRGADAFSDGDNYIRFVAVRPVAGIIEITVSKTDNALICNGLQIVANEPQQTLATDGAADHPHDVKP